MALGGGREMERRRLKEAQHPTSSLSGAGGNMWRRQFSGNEEGVASRYVEIYPIRACMRRESSWYKQSHLSLKTLSLLLSPEAHSLSEKPHTL